MRILLQMNNEPSTCVVVMVVRICVVTNQSPNSMFVLGHLFMTETMDLFLLPMMLLYLR